MRFSCLPSAEQMAQDRWRGSAGTVYSWPHRKLPPDHQCHETAPLLSAAPTTKLHNCEKETDQQRVKQNYWQQAVTNIICAKTSRILYSNIIKWMTGIMLPSKQKYPSINISKCAFAVSYSFKCKICASVAHIFLGKKCWQHWQLGKFKNLKNCYKRMINITVDFSDSKKYTQANRHITPC